jgi:hypothetical protein
MEPHDGYNPQFDKYKQTKAEDREERFFETLDRLMPDWRRWFQAGAVALPLTGFVIWAFETFIIVP